MLFRHRRICRQSRRLWYPGQGALLIEAIAGDYYAIMGLPIAKVARLLKDSIKRQSFSFVKRERTVFTMQTIRCLFGKRGIIEPIN